MHEARLERHRMLARRPEQPCPAACAEAAGLCAEGDAICRLAARTEDADLWARCRRARGICEDTRGRVGWRCACDPLDGAATRAARDR